MKILFNPNVTKPNFKGTTAIRAVTDSHQEARLESTFLSKVAEDAKKQNNILLLNCGDLFCGVYSRDLMSDLYLRFKKENPNVEVVMTIGNNDPISSKDKYAPKDPTDARVLVSSVVAALSAPVINTGLFIIGLSAFFTDTLYAWSGGTNVMLYIFTGLIGINFLIEFGINAIISPAISTIVKISTKKLLKKD